MYVVRQRTQFCVDRLERVPIRITLELYARIVFIEENIGRSRRIDGLVIQTTRHSVPERVANFLTIWDVLGRLRVEPSSEFKPNSSVIAEILAVDGLGLDSAILDDVDEVVNLGVVFDIDLGLKEF